MFYCKIQRPSISGDCSFHVKTLYQRPRLLVNVEHVLNRYPKLQAISVILKAFRTFHFSFPITCSIMIDFLSNFHSDHHHNHPATESAHTVAELASLDYQVFGQRQRAFWVLESLARLSFSSSCCQGRVRYTSWSVRFRSLGSNLKVGVGVIGLDTETNVIVKLLMRWFAWGYSFYLKTSWKTWICMWKSHQDLHPTYEHDFQISHWCWNLTSANPTFDKFQQLHIYSEKRYGIEVAQDWVVLRFTCRIRKGVRNY